MKKSYIRVLALEILILLALLFNSFLTIFITRYMTVVFYALCILAFRLLFKFEKDRHLQTNSTLIYICMYLLGALVIYFVFGIFSGFIRNANYYDFYGMKTFIIPILLTALLKEFLRYQVLQKTERNKLLIICTIVLFIFADISNAVYYADFSDAYDVLVFIGLNLLPSIGRNVVCTLITLKTGYKPAMLFSAFLDLYKYLLPIVPDFSEYVESVFNLLLPSVLAVLLVKHFKDRLDEDLESKVIEKRSILPTLVGIVIIGILVYFTSGYFSYQAIAIASGSMNPTYDRGSVVIIKKVDNNYDEIEVGEILAYEYESTIITHRIVNIVEAEGKRYFYTKGDANDDVDNYKIEEEMVIGTINTYIPFLGYPTVLLSEL